jgi:hypothetical protein
VLGVQGAGVDEGVSAGFAHIRAGSILLKACCTVSPRSCTHLWAVSVFSAMNSYNLPSETGTLNRTFCSDPFPF